ncbi:MAG: alpha/beta fold hydrolase [Kiritimatiellae bacterium]|nr:alpha/beta fold hydrolase [Kiritimatiellia bacterium]MDD5521744.1 alpha/beta fold hydrolase [Kiritimatiellia bacterium]
MNYSRLFTGLFFFILFTIDASPADKRKPNPGADAKLEKPGPLCVYELSEDQHKARGMLNTFVQENLAKMGEMRKAELAALKTPEDWKARQKRTRARLHEFFGEFPPKTPLNSKVIGKLDRDKYVIEKVIFESQPDYFCTANLYIPKGRKFPVPGVLFTCGHAAEGKGYHLYHECCLGLVLKGYVVLAFDPMGQGERSEYFDPQTKKTLVSLTVSQHHYVGRPAFLVDWSLSGLRTWDAIRALDYLVSRPEVDKEKLAATGNSGGGQMGFLITAVDERIKVCVVDHPGGSMENTYLLGQKLIDREVLSLIPPRPCKIVVGKDSGEEAGHRSKLDDMQLFYEGLGVGKQLGQMEIVHGVHDMKQPKREPGYEWLNKWFGKEEEGKAEPPLQPEKPETLRCTESGFTLISLGGETGQALNAKRAERIYKPEKDLAKLKERIAERLHFKMPSVCDAPHSRSMGIFTTNDFSAEKLVYKSEQGVELPTLLLRPKEQKTDNPVIIHVSDKGKPVNAEPPSLPIALVLKGYTVLSVDVRGIGETDPSPPVTFTQYTGYTPPQWQRDCLAIQSATFKRTMLGMRALDVVRAIDLIKSRDDLKKSRVVLIGEGLGGLCALVAGAYDTRPASIVCVGTLPSYKLLMSNKYYNVWNYFWVPGALRDYDIPDLVRLAVPRPQLWVDTVDALADRFDGDKASSVIGSHEGLRVVKTDNGSVEEECRVITELIK